MLLALPNMIGDMSYYDTDFSTLYAWAVLNYRLLFSGLYSHANDSIKGDKR